MREVGTISLSLFRAAPPDAVANTIRAASSKRQEPLTLSSNFFFAYGTRPSMKSFEKVCIIYFLLIHMISKNSTGLTYKRYILYKSKRVCR